MLFRAILNQIGTTDRCMSQLQTGFSIGINFTVSENREEVIEEI